CVFGSYTASGGGGGSSWATAAATNVTYSLAVVGNGTLAIAPTPPTISSFTPATGTFGTTVTITGDFANGATGVLFNGVAASSFTLVNATTVTAVVPSSTTGPISVVGPGGTATSATNFTPIYLSVTGLNPTRNAPAAARNTTVGLTLSQAPTAASAAGIRIFSGQYKGRRTASVAVSSNTATLTPSGGSFRPGEVVRVSMPSTVQSSSGTRA
ncbi:IPT/TIG domain-containing protein, partial [Hymenobacter agri]